jgi:hypothetical protein
MRRASGRCAYRRHALSSPGEGTPRLLAWRTGRTRGRDPPDRRAAADRPEPAGAAGRAVHYFLKNETNADQATFLARAEIYQGDYRRANQFVDELRAITPRDVQRVANQYIRDFRFAYIGDPKKVSAELLRGF